MFGDVIHRQRRHGGHDVGGDLRRTGLVGTRQDRSLPHRRMLGEPSLDLTQLDAMAADLDLLVRAPQELEIPIGQDSGEIAGAVAARAGLARRGIRDETLGGQVGPAAITTGQLHPRHINLAAAARMNGRQPLIQHLDRHAVDRAANGHRAGRAAAGRDLIGAAAHDGFGRPVFVDDPDRRGVAPPGRDRFGEQVLATDHQRGGRSSQRCAWDRRVEHFEMGGRDLQEAVTRFARKDAAERRDPTRIGKHAHPSTAEQGRKEAGQGQVKGNRRMHHGPGSLLDRIGVDAPLQVTGKAAMGQHHALGPAR